MIWGWRDEKYVPVDPKREENRADEFAADRFSIPSSSLSANLEQEKPIAKVTPVYATLMVNTQYECEGCHPHHLTLDEQLAIFDEKKWHVLQTMREELYNEEFLSRVMLMARERLIEGYETYGSEMYQWEHEERKKNEAEEVADRIVYGTSQP